MFCSLLPLVVITLAAAWHIRQTLLDASRAESLTVARLIAADIGQVSQHTEQLLTALAVSLRDRRTLNEACAPIQRLARAYPYYHQLAVADAGGSILCTAVPLQGPVNVGDREYFRELLERRAYVTSPLIRSRSTHALTLVGALPLLDVEGRVKGALLASIDLDWMRRLIAQIQLPEAAVVSVVDGGGTILARFPDGAVHVGKKVPDLERFLEMIRSQGEGTGDMRGHDAVERVIAFSQVHGFGREPLFVRVGIPRSVADAYAARLLYLGVGALLLVGVLAAAAAWIGSRRLVLEPVERLIGAAERLGSGDLSARTGLAHDGTELGRLAEKLDQLASSVQRHERALRTLSGCNRNLIRNQSGQDLLNNMCAVAVERGGYRAASVVFANNGSVSVVARAGARPGLFRAFGVAWSDMSAGESVVMRAVRSGTPCVVHDLAESAEFAYWQDELRALEMNALIALPLRAEDRVLGAFVLIAAEREAFDADEIHLLLEMADDLAYGIFVLRNRVRQANAEARVAYASTHDPLTGLPNRSALLSHLESAMADSKGEAKPLAVLAVHIERVQELFDALGYDPTNRILIELADRLRGTGVDKGLTARVSVEDFCVVLASRQVAQAEEISRRIHAALSEAVPLGDARIEVQVSVGAAEYPVHGDIADLLVRRAVLASREGARRDAVYFMYRGATERENPARLALVAELRAAIENGQLALHYQPKLDIASGKIVAAEALVRWRHPQRGMVPPGEFIGVAEQTGLIRPLTAHIIALEVNQQQAWRAMGVQLPVAVNISARTLLEPQWQRHLTGVLGERGIAPDMIELEITESALVEEPTIAALVLTTLRDLGFRIHIDDFGTGYSSLNYLVSLPVHALKIDRTFVASMKANHDAYLVVSSVVSMAHGLGLRVIALGTLRDLGSNEAQGYFIAKPMPAEEFVKQLAALE